MTYSIVGDRDGDGLGFAVPLAVVKGASVVKKLGGLLHHNNNKERLAHADELYRCASAGDVRAAQSILWNTTRSATKEGRAKYQALWAQLSATAPAVYAAAVSKGAQTDQGTWTGKCYTMTGPLVAAPTVPVDTTGVVRAPSSYPLPASVPSSPAVPVYASGDSYGGDDSGGAVERSPAIAQAGMTPKLPLLVLGGVGLLAAATLLGSGNKRQ